MTSENIFALQVRTLPGGREAARFKYNYYVSNLKFSPDGRRLVALSSDPQGFATVHRMDTAGWLRTGSAHVSFRRIPSWVATPRS